MNCWHCQSELIWGGDHSLEEEEWVMVTNLSCPRCGSYVEVYLPEYLPERTEKPANGKNKTAKTGN